MIIWVNGPFDPEYVGYILIKWAPPADSGDFQDMPLWRKLVAEFAVGLAGEYGRPLIVPMTLVNASYRDEDQVIKALTEIS